MTIPLNERKNNRDSTNECGFVFAAAQMMIRKKTIEYNNDTENYSIEQRTTVNLTILYVVKNPLSHVRQSIADHVPSIVFKLAEWHV